MSNSTFSNLVRLYPNQAQLTQLRRNCGCRRFVYNKMLEYQKQRYQDHKDGKAEYGYIPYEEMCSLLLALKADPETAWLQEVNAQSLQQTLKDLDKGFKRFFKHEAGYPVEKKRGRGDSFRAPQSCAVSSDFGAVLLPKLGWIPCRGLRKNRLVDTEGKSTFLSVQSVTVKSVADHFEAAVLFRVPELAPAKHQRPGSSCGVDIGIAKPLAVADDDADCYTYGTKVRDRLRRHDLYVKRLHRRLARQVQGSNSRQRTKTKLAKAYRHAACVREDFNHQLSNHLARTYQFVVTEALPLQNMTASAAGTEDQPGTGVKQKSGLNREMLRLAPGQFNVYLEYKCRRYGGELIRVNPAYSSCECSECHYIDKNNRKNQAVFKCMNPACGHTENADYNAAKVLRYRGLELLKQRRELAQVEGASRPVKPKPGCRKTSGSSLADSGGLVARDAHAGRDLTVRTVSYTEFVGLPNGTVFQYLDDGQPAPGLFVKAEPIVVDGEAIDFFRTPLFNEDSDGAARPVFSPSCSRDALYDHAREFLVLDTQDVRLLVGLLGVTVCSNTILAGPGAPN